MVHARTEIPTDMCKNTTLTQLRLRGVKRICCNGVIAALRVAAGNAVETGEQWLALNDRETEGCFRWKVPDHLFEYPVVFDNFAGGISTKKCFKWLDGNPVEFSRKGTNYEVDLLRTILNPIGGNFYNIFPTLGVLGSTDRMR